MNNFLASLLLLAVAIVTLFPLWIRINSDHDEFTEIHEDSENEK